MAEFSMEACLCSKRKESLNSKFQQLEGNSKIVSKDVTQSAVQNNSISFQIFQMQTCRVIVSEVKQYYLITAFSTGAHFELRVHLLPNALI